MRFFKENILNKVVKFVLILIGTFALLPFNIKGFSVVVFSLLGFLCFFRFNIAISKKKLIINSILYVLYLISIFYTDDIGDGFKSLQTTLSLIVFPITFILISGNKEICQLVISNKKTFLNSFFVSGSIFSLLVLWKSFGFLDLTNNRVLINPFLTELNTDFYWFSDHPIYLSLVIALSLILIPEIFVFKPRRTKFFIILCFLIQLIALIIISRKSILVAFVLVFSLRMLLLKGISIKSILYSVCFLGIISLLTLQFSSDTIKRFREVFDKKSYNKVESFSSTSIRYHIYGCSLDVAKGNLLFGYGIGDVKTKLKECYKDVSDVLYNGNYNTHNQYMGTVLYIGVFGLIFFLFSIGFNFHLYIINRDYLALCLLIMFILTMIFENILDRQNGVILYAFFINYFSFINIIKSE